MTNNGKRHCLSVYNTNEVKVKAVSIALFDQIEALHAYFPTYLLANKWTMNFRRVQ